MKCASFLLILLCFGFLLCDSVQAQTRRIIRNPNSKTHEEIFKPNDKGCRARYAAGYNQPKPSDVIGGIKYLYYFLRGEILFAAVEYSCAPVIQSVKLSQAELTVCSNGGSCSEKSETIEIETDATDSDGDILLYTYTVSGGKIIGDGSDSGGKIVGDGSKVIWDLSGVKAGTYTLSVMVDDGCGICIKPVEKEIRVVECADCKTLSEEPKQ